MINWDGIHILVIKLYNTPNFLNTKKKKKNH